MVFQILEFSKLKDNKAMSWQSFYAWRPFWKKITKNLKITNNKDLPHQLFKKVWTRNMLFLLFGLKGKRKKVFIPRCKDIRVGTI